MENIHYIIFNLVYIFENVNIRHISVHYLKHLRYDSTLLSRGPVCLVSECSYIAWNL
jgi:hypothetical protein